MLEFCYSKTKRQVKLLILLEFIPQSTRSIIGATENLLPTVAPVFAGFPA